MECEVRRVITGHNDQGRAVFAIDAVKPRSDERGVLVWTTNTSPANNSDNIDWGNRPELKILSPHGSLIRLQVIQPGRVGRMHRTNSVDYAIVLEGELDLELDDGARTHLKAGDIVVQRGTMHAWHNPYPNPCKIVFILYDAHPVEVNGTVLEPTDI